MHYLRWGDTRTKEPVCRAFRTLIGAYGDKNVIITHAPGRLNLMGRHIDHRGGGTNGMAVDRDAVLVSDPRDDVFSIVNTDPSYPDRAVSVSKHLSLAPHEVWLDYLLDTPVKQDLQESRGDWSNYIQSAALRLHWKAKRRYVACPLQCLARSHQRQACFPLPVLLWRLQKQL